MYVNMIKEVLNNNNEVIERHSVSFDTENTNPCVIEYFESQGWKVADETEERMC